MASVLFIKTDGISKQDNPGLKFQLRIGLAVERKETQKKQGASVKKKVNVKWHTVKHKIKRSVMWPFVGADHSNFRMLEIMHRPCRLMLEKGERNFFYSQ